MIGADMVVDWIKKAPTSLVIAVVIAVAAATVAYLLGYVYLTAHGVDTTEYRALLNTGFNYLAILLGATSTVASVSAARSASNAEEQTNGLHTAQLEQVAAAAANAAAIKALQEAQRRGGRP